MRKSVIAATAGTAAFLAFAVAGCGGGGTPHPSSGDGGGSSGTLSPYKQQKLAQDASQVCDSTGSKQFQTSISYFLRGVESDVGWSRGDVITWTKQVVKDQCPEYLDNISLWERECDLNVRDHLPCGDHPEAH